MTDLPVTIGGGPGQRVVDLGSVEGRQREDACLGVAGVEVGVDPERIVLTASTSEAYSVLFKLLCDPGDEVLIPQPSYPLFELLSQLDGVVARPYRLDAHACWAIDRDPELTLMMHLGGIAIPAGH